MLHPLRSDRSALELRKQEFEVQGECEGLKLADQLGLGGNDWDWATELARKPRSD